MEQYPDIQKSFNGYFCNVLMFHLCHTFKNLATGKFERFWCDGVHMPFVDSRLYKSNIDTTKEIITSAYMGLNGQQEYYMTIKLGPLSLDRCYRDMPLIDCLPGEDTMDWITLDIPNKKIELRLK